jgi:receptor-binding and translocation channel-forming TcA subunit of Tc toxin
MPDLPPVEFELTKNISLLRLNPLALLELRETGKCYVSIPEELFDLDFRGHYFRRIKAVRLSIPCFAGPYTLVSCSLRLLSNTIRVNTALNSEGKYEHENNGGLWTDDDRFVSNYTPVTAIATCTAQNDSGMFAFNFREERYIPFERAGAISSWQIELSTEKELRQFDYETIADVIIQMSYTAREDGGIFKDSANTYIKDYISSSKCHEPD